MKIFFKLINIKFIGTFASGFITRHLAYIYEVTTTFITCTQEAKEMQRELPISAENKNKIYEEINS